MTLKGLRISRFVGAFLALESRVATRAITEEAVLTVELLIRRQLAAFVARQLVGVGARVFRNGQINRLKRSAALVCPRLLAMMKSNMTHDPSFVRHLHVSTKFTRVMILEIMRFERFVRVELFVTQFALDQRIGQVFLLHVGEELETIVSLEATKEASHFLGVGGAQSLGAGVDVQRSCVHERVGSQGFGPGPRRDGAETLRRRRRSSRLAFRNPGV